MRCQLGRGLVLRQELSADLLAANSAGRRADGVTWLDLGLERLTSLGGGLGRPLGGPLAAYTALVDLSATANQLTCIQGKTWRCLTSSCHSSCCFDGNSCSKCQTGGLARSAFRAQALQCQ